MQFLSALLAALAVATVGVIQSGANAIGGCKNPTVKDSQVIGHVNLTTYACDTPFEVKHTPARPRTPTGDPPAKRQFNACTTPAPECQSAVLCNSDYCNGPPSSAPIPKDCTNLENELTGGGNTGTFFVPPGYYLSASYGTCEFNWGNLGTFELEYSFFNLGDRGGIVYNNCINVDRDGGGYCISDSGLYYIQVA